MVGYFEFNGHSESMAKRRQRIYTKYKPQKSLPRKTDRGMKGRLLALLVVIVGLTAWAAVTGKIVLPGPLQEWVKAAEPKAEQPGSEPAELPPISNLNFGTTEPAPRPVPMPPIPVPAPKIAVPSLPIAGSSTNSNPGSAPVKPEIKVTLPPVAPAPLAEQFRPRSAWSTYDIQLALARNAISPGILDGYSGPQTVQALRAFQQRAGLEPSGKADIRTKSQLVLTQPPYTSYLVTSNDVAGLRKLGKTWPAKAAQDGLGYESVVELVAEKSHAYERFIEQLNPKVDWKKMAPGTRLKVPLVQYPEPTAKAAFLRISLTNHTLQAFDAQTNLLAHFPCSIAKRVEKRPVGELRVINVVDGPNYTFDPLNFPPGSESRKIETKLTIQPGPNNPVGTAWIGLNKPGYGIHGTPLPAKIGRTESLGCFRLANWDASYLLRLVVKEMPVFVEP
jgi:lipoprotein-anchoring transpeptidase ErfK/SrfK